MSSSAPRKTERPAPSQVRSLVLNQTIGVLAVAGLVAALLGSERVQALASSTSLGAHVFEWLVSKARAARPVDVLFAGAMLAAMVGWTAAFHGFFVHGKAVSRAEWRPGGAGSLHVALYLVLSASIVEEIVFRGIALPGAAYFLGTTGGLAASAALFGMLHFEKGRPGQIVVAGYGLILGGGLLLGASLPACVLAHAAGNALAFFFPSRFVSVRG